MSQRLSLALEPGGQVLPESGAIAVFNPTAAQDLSALPKDRVLIIQPFRPDYDHFAAQGYACHAALPEGTRAAAAVVFIPRAKPLARALAAEAAAVTDGVVLIDGAKTDGIDSILKELKKRAAPSAPISKAHGKIFWIEGADLTDWRAQSSQVDGFTTAPGVFSADGIDPASRILAENLPPKLGRRVADFGAGWGYLSAGILKREGVEVLHLVEANHTALDCAKANVRDARAQFHWADARSWKAGEPLDTVVMNPPFHTTRKAEPSLGQAFIEAAARGLTGSGHLWLVANRHLPYEDALQARFAAVEEAAGDNRFKVLHASRPRKTRR